MRWKWCSTELDDEMLIKLAHSENLVRKYKKEITLFMTNIPSPLSAKDYTRSSSLTPWARTRNHF